MNGGSGRRLAVRGDDTTAPAEGVTDSGDAGGLLTPSALLGAAVAVVLVLPWSLRTSPAHAVLSALQVAVAGAGIARSTHPGLRPVALVTFVFTFAWLGIAPAYQLATGDAAWGDDAVLVGPYTTEALVLLVLATTTLYVAFFRPGRDRPVPAGHAEVDEPPRWVCAGYVLACLVLTPGAVAAAGGVGGLFSSRSARGEALGSAGISLAQSGGLAVALVGILPGALATAAAYLTLIRVLAQVRRSGWGDVDAVDAVLLAAGLALVVLFANPLVNTRALSAAALGSLVLLVLRPRSGPAARWMAVALLMATLVAYPAANAFRGTTTNTAGPEGLEFLAGIDFDGFQQAINALQYVDERGHSWGTYALSGVFYVVPRSIWADKERPASIDVAENRGYEFTNLSLPVHSELFVDFGTIGMVVALALLATAGRRCDLDWTRGARTRWALAAPYACLACLSIIRGPIGANAPVYLTNLGLIAVGLLLARRSVAPGDAPVTGGGGPDR
ncbi:hypothetical protein SAMN04488107_4251 [Geodermatophilus saharensis]|uniref:Oligosaccharide repeat unit polymerase n=1 Tax=Geodermatophilus saharensis TaxID=1137994 RepID=A0A239IDF4_9ACTN|nr:hypothetical protein [Geodermatophilus saharensis]SNS90454.1 hypothetical protein SAMN04488107_4251 [Geodermatophilus saharensis]